MQQPGKRRLIRAMIEMAAGAAIVRHSRVKLGNGVKSGFAYWPLNKVVIT